MNRHLAIEFGVDDEIAPNDVANHDLCGLCDRKVYEVKSHAFFVGRFWRRWQRLPVANQPARSSRNDAGSSPAS
ncbi:hypothetical protein [Methylocystis sp.]|uniref:hypothetical protein n=1 Tax=Methylocystis sp. TaxID=1911079 RepID=UPI003DA56AA0